LTKSIVRRLMIGLTLTIGMSSAITVLLFAAYELRKGDAELDHSIDDAVVELAQIVEPSLWDLDLERASTIGEAFARDPRVVRLTIREATGGATHTVVRSTTTDTVWRTRRVVHEGREVGQVGIAFSRGLYRAEIWRQVGTAFGVSLIALIATFFGVRYLIRRLLNRPLVELSNIVGAYAAGDYSPAGVSTPYAEFGAFYSVLGAMGEKILRQLSDLQAANSRLSGEVRVREEVEANLRNSRNMLAHVMDTVPQSIFWKDRDGVYLGGNAVFAKDAGLSSPDSVPGKTDFELPWPRAAAEEYRAIDREVLDENRPRIHIIERQERKDGTIRWRDTTKIPLADASGQVIGLLGVSDDITEQRRAEVALRRGNQELAALNRILGLAAAEVEPTELLERACREVATILDLPLSGAGLLDHSKSAIKVIAEYASVVRPSIVGTVIPIEGIPFVQALLQGKVPMISERVRDDPRLGPVAPLLTQRGVFSMIALPLVVDGEAVGGMALSSMERRTFTPAEISLASSVAAQVESALARHRAHSAERLLRAAIEQTPESVVMTNTSGGVVYVNPAFTAITGYSRDEMLGHNPNLLKSGRHDAAFYGEMWGTLLSGGTWRGQITNRKKNGDLFVEDAIIAPVRDPRGVVTNYIAVKRDITREIEQEERFRHAQRMEAVGQLAGGIAHDFNNILGAIILELEMLQLEHELPDAMTRAIHEVRRSVERAANLTRQLLMFSRRQAMNVQPQDLNVVVADLLRMLMRVIGENITVAFARSDTPVPFEGDAGMIEQIVMNLCVNARDAMPDGGRLTITTRIADVDAEAARRNAEARPGRFAFLEVSDTGHGMTPEVLLRLFEPFFTTKDVGRGTGLGLATTHGLVAQHQGWIEVESDVGQGSTFRVYLPALEAVVAETKRKSQPVVMGGTATILVVEDEPLIRPTLVRSLRRLGYHVVEASNGVEALRVWASEEGRIDLVLTDMVMPEGVSGSELSMQLRRMKPNLKVIIMSGYSRQRATGADFTAHDIDYLAKPFTLGALGDTVRRVLEREEAVGNREAGSTVQDS
jgi:PAS domain S-box-containing protein